MALFIRGTGAITDGFEPVTPPGQVSPPPTTANPQDGPLSVVPPQSIQSPNLPPVSTQPDPSGGVNPPPGWRKTEDKVEPLDLTDELRKIFENVYQGNPDNLDAALRALEQERDRRLGRLGDSDTRNLAFDVISRQARALGLDSWALSGMQRKLEQLGYDDRQIAGALLASADVLKRLGMENREAGNAYLDGINRYLELQINGGLGPQLRGGRGGRPAQPPQRGSQSLEEVLMDTVGAGFAALSIYDPETLSFFNAASGRWPRKSGDQIKALMRGLQQRYGKDRVQFDKTVLLAGGKKFTIQYNPFSSNPDLWRLGKATNLVGNLADALEFGIDLHTIWNDPNLSVPQQIAASGIAGVTAISNFGVGVVANALVSLGAVAAPQTLGGSTAVIGTGIGLNLAGGWVVDKAEDWMYQQCRCRPRE